MKITPKEWDEISGYASDILAKLGAIPSDNPLIPKDAVFNLCHFVINLADTMVAEQRKPIPTCDVIRSSYGLPQCGDIEIPFWKSTFNLVITWKESETWEDIKKTYRIKRLGLITHLMKELGTYADHYDGKADIWPNSISVFQCGSRGYLFFKDDPDKAENYSDVNIQDCVAVQFNHFALVEFIRENLFIWMM